MTPISAPIVDWLDDEVVAECKLSCAMFMTIVGDDALALVIFSTHSASGMVGTVAVSSWVEVTSIKKTAVDTFAGRA